MYTHLKNFVPLFAFKVVVFSLDSLQPSNLVEILGSVVFGFVLCCTCWGFVSLK